MVPFVLDRAQGKTGQHFVRDFLFVLGDARRQWPGIFALFLFAAVLDLSGLGMILPLIAAITTPEAPRALDGVDLEVLAAGVVLLYVFRAIVAFWVQRTIARFSEEQRGLLMSRLLDAYLRKPYEYHLEKNSAVLINNTLNLTWGFAAGVLSSTLRLATDLVTFAVILGFLAWTQWQVVAIATSTLTLVLAAYTWLTRGTIARSGEILAATQSNSVRVINHALGGLREVRVLGIEQHAVAEMRVQAELLAATAGNAAAIQALPRYLVETSFIALLAGLAVLVRRDVVDSTELVPTLGLFAVAAIRLMPGSTSIIGSLNMLRANRYALHQLAEDLSDSDVPFTMASGQASFRGFKSIALAGVEYRYPNATLPALRSINLTIRAGEAVGIIGRSGAGKSTLADVILGLIHPQAGRVLVDGRDVADDVRAWMNELAYIPQTVFVRDDTLRANIALGVAADRVDEGRLAAALAASQLEDVLAGLPRGLDTVLGERGVRLSGGQRQRVALARALYHDRQLIVMDEATAALDSETEAEVIRAIRTLRGKRTLIIISHRPSTLEGCDQIVEL